MMDLTGHIFKVVKFATDVTLEVKQHSILEFLSLIADSTDNFFVIAGLIEYVNASFGNLACNSAKEAIRKNSGHLLQGAHTDKA